MPSGVKRTHDEFLRIFANSNSASKEIEIVGQYETNNTPIACICRVCGYHWSPTPKSLLGNHGCPKCSGNAKMSHEEFVSSFNEHNPNASTIELLGTYQSISKKIKCRCIVCSYEWDARCGDLIYSKSGCPQCASRYGYSHNKFLADIQVHNPNFDNIIFLSEYSGSLNRISCKCKICGHEWEPLATSLRQGSGCPMCAKERIAKISGEQLRKLPKPVPLTHTEFVERFIEKNPHSETIEILGKYSGATQKLECRCKRCGTVWSTIASGLMSGTGCPKCSHSSTSFMEQFIATALMFALNDTAIIQRDRKTIGKELDIYVPDYNFAIEIGSWKWHKKSYKIDLQKQKLCQEKDIRLIIIYDLCAELPTEQKDVYFYAIDLGSETNHSILKNLVGIILHQMDVQYSFSADEWNEITKLAYENSQRMNHDDFIAKFKKNNKSADTIEILTEYTRSIDKIKCKCTVCNHIWETAATELIRGSGCPKCKIAEVGLKKSKRHIISEWRKQNPNGSKLKCEKETGISRMTVYKWWDDVD